jgi:hypothetical protein
LMFEKDQYYKHLFTDALREQLYRTGFREIFFPLRCWLIAGFIFH